MLHKFVHENKNLLFTPPLPPPSDIQIQQLEVIKISSGDNKIRLNNENE